ncbi:hypothetical protein H0H93_011412 [Arthromyces matolae]|nr:hypothetical protein H0H93_011412 [Arthromyces matolae]
MGAFDTTVGVLLLGLFFNTYLYGLVTYQFMVYANTMAIYAGWEMCVTNYANPANLAFVSWTIPFTACATSLAAILTQFFLGHRVWILTKNVVFVSMIGLCSVVGFIFGIYAGVRSGIIHEVAHFGPLKPFVICWLGFQTAADLLITFVLSAVLSRSRTGFRKTDTIINRLIRGAIQTGLFASIFALADLFSFVLHGDTNLYAMFAFPIGRIYTNTLLDTLNARVELKLLNSSTMDVEGENTTNAFRMQTQSQTVAGQTLHSIHISKETITQTSPEERSVEKYRGDEEFYTANSANKV